MFFGHNMYINEKQFLCYLRNWSIVAFEKQLIIYLILNQSIVFVSLCCEINQVISKCQMGFLDKTYKKKGSKQKSNHYHRIFHIRSSLDIKFQRKLNFWTKLTQKEYFQSKKEKKENHRPILCIRISLDPKCQLQQIILSNSGQKQKK